MDFILYFTYYIINMIKIAKNRNNNIIKIRDINVYLYFFHK